jgi:hypothetical protein
MGSLDFLVVNGSVHRQIQNIPLLNWTNAYPLHYNDSGANISIFPDGATQLNFNPGNGSFALSLPVISMLLNPNAIRNTIDCTYPLSGQYDHLPRILFYVSLVVSVLFRRFPVIATAALGSVMTYSTVAAIHLFVLLGLFDFGLPSENVPPAKFSLAGWDSRSAATGGDIDVWGIVPVISATAVMLTPILAWSNTFRSHKARSLVVYWAIIIFVAMALLYQKFVDNVVEWRVDVIPSFAFCTNTSPYCQELGKKFGINFIEDYNECNCVDFCALLSPPAPMRRDANMGALLHHRAISKFVCTDDNCEDNDSIRKSVTFMLTLVLVMWAIVILQGIVTLLHSQTRLSTARNFIFRMLYNPLLTPVALVFKDNRRRRIISRFHLDRTGSRSWTRRIRLFVAKTIAASYYLLTVLGMFLYPVLFIITIFACELIVGTWATSEHSDSVGAWSPWVAACIVVLSSIIVEKHSQFVGHLGTALSKPFNYIRYDGSDRPNRQQRHEGQEDRPGLKFKVDDIWTHIVYHRKLMSWAFQDEYRHFVEWWKDPTRFSVVNVDR